MKPTIKHVMMLLANLICLGLFSQNSQTVSVRLNASVVASPPSITLSWASLSGATTTGFTIYRKLKTGTSWGSSIATLAGTATSFQDTNVSVNTLYDYKVTRTATISTTTYTGYGYISTGIEVDAVINRGIILLVIDSTFVSSLSSEITTYQADLKAEGWRVKTFYVGRNASVVNVKNTIVTAYNTEAVNTKAVMLIGHVPVPYSGNFAPDGHSNHVGAWPADVYYADMNGTWTDASVNNTSASRTQNDNIPGDGKFDQTYIADGSAELQVGRIDLANMTAFTTKTELQLLQDYMAKDHNYRVKNYTTIQRGIIDDNFGYFSGEAFAANGWRSISTIVGNSNVSSGDYITSLAAGSYQWAYGCGGGSYTSASGIGTTDSFVNNSVQGTFSMLFGSYFGDWDATNSFLRAPLCSGTTLTNVWGGRPNWFFQHMAMGENIGYSVQLSQNNNSVYSPTGFYPRGVHQALMGDLTLRNDIIKPGSNLNYTAGFGTGTLKWNKTSDVVLGYNVYVNNGDSIFTKLNGSIITDSTYTYSCLPHQSNSLYVKAVKLQQTPSGTYYNESPGIEKVLTNFVVATPSIDSSNNKTYYFKHGHDTCNAYTHTYKWYFGDGVTSTQRNPVHTYANYGFYWISLVVKNGCYTDSQIMAIYIAQPPIPFVQANRNENQNQTTVGGLQGKVSDAKGNASEVQVETTENLQVYPNPTSSTATIALQSGKIITELKVYNLAGEEIYALAPNNTQVIIDFTTQAKGLYQLLVTDENKKQYVTKIVVR